MECVLPNQGFEQINERVLSKCFIQLSKYILGKVNLTGAYVFTKCIFRFLFDSHENGKGSYKLTAMWDSPPIQLPFNYSTSHNFQQMNIDCNCKAYIPVMTVVIWVRYIIFLESYLLFVCTQTITNLRAWCYALVLYSHHSPEDREINSHETLSSEKFTFVCVWFICNILIDRLSHQIRRIYNIQNKEYGI